MEEEFTKSDLKYIKKMEIKKGRIGEIAYMDGKKYIYGTDKEGREKLYPYNPLNYTEGKTK